MGYQTTFDGSVLVDPPLSQVEVAFLKKFNETRRMHRKSGPYFVDGSGFMGQGYDADIIDYNNPDPSQPGLWCPWVPTEDGSAIEWDEGEKSYDADEWMKYLIEHFVGPNPLAKSELPFLSGHAINGTIEANGEDPDDVWALVVTDSNVVLQHGTVIRPWRR